MNPVITFLKNCLPDPRAVVLCDEEDCFLWQIGDRTPAPDFSTSLMWTHLYDRLPEVTWHKSIWFKGRIPKHAFLSWLIALNRLSIKDRMSQWGVPVSSTCLLCGSADETRQHLFLECDYSKEVHTFFFSPVHLSLPPLIMDVLGWIKAPTRDSNINLILKLTFQASLYMLWKERNSRMHNQLSRPAVSLVQEIQRLLRAKMDILSRDQRNLPTTVTFLSTWRHLYTSS